MEPILSPAGAPIQSNFAGEGRHGAGGTPHFRTLQPGPGNFKLRA